MKFLIHKNLELYGNHNQCTDLVITGASTSYSSKLLCTSVVPRPMLVVFSLGMRLRVYMHTNLQNGILRNGQQPQSDVMFH